MPFFRVPDKKKVEKGSGIDTAVDSKERDNNNRIRVRT